MTSVEGFLARLAMYREAASSGSIRPTGAHLHEHNQGPERGLQKRSFRLSFIEVLLEKRGSPPSNGERASFVRRG